MTDTFIYFILDPQQNAVKIGKTAQPLVRLAELRAQYGEQLVPILWLIKPTLFERQLHQYFAADHLQGEWFHYSESIQQFINQQSIPSQLAARLLAELHLHEIRLHLEAELQRIRLSLELLRLNESPASGDQSASESQVGTIRCSVDRLEAEWMKVLAQLTAQQAAILQLQSQLELAKERNKLVAAGLEAEKGRTSRVVSRKKRL